MDGEVAAMALWFLNFSTWDGVEGIYLEDLFVRPQFRRLGLARGLLAALARECVDHDYTRLAWAVLNWNTDAVALYRVIGAQPQSEWTTYRVSGPELRRARRTGPGTRRRRTQRTAAGLNSSANAVNAKTATGIPISARCESTVRYQATGSSNSSANTASPRPQRRPTSNDQPAASTALPARANHAAVPNPLIPR